MRYNTETYSLELEIVFTFRNDPSVSRRFKLLHGLSSATACGVLFSLKCAGCTIMRKSELKTTTGGRIISKREHYHKLLHGLSSAAACGVLFSLKCAGCTTMRKSELFISS